jgi:hypothetical protein
MLLAFAVAVVFAAPAVGICCCGGTEVELDWTRDEKMV